MIVPVDLSIKAGLALFGRLQSTVVIKRGTSYSMKIEVGSIEILEATLLPFVLSSSNPAIHTTYIKKSDLHR